MICGHFVSCLQDGLHDLSQTFKELLKVTTLRIISTAKMESCSSTTRLTSFVISLLLLAMVGCGRGANANDLSTSTHPSLRSQCPNLNFFQRSRSSSQGTCLITGLLGILPEPNLNTNAKTTCPPWSFPPKCMTLAYSSKISSLSSSYQSSPSASSTSLVSSASSSSSLSSSAFASADDISGNMYCLFTTDSLYNGHGTTFLVSLNTASNLLGLGSLEDQPPPWKWVPGMRSGCLQSDSDINQTDLAYRIVGAKGKGIIAVRPIKQGEIIVVDYPALLISDEFLHGTEREGKGHLRRRMVKRGLEQLPEITRQMVMELQRGPGEYEVDAILGINLKGLGGIGGSALALLEEPGKMDEGDGLMGLFTEVARINHSCRPNARLRFSENRLTMEVISYRQISAGEEILISYTPLTLPPSDRHQFLKQNYHFTCHCPLCASLSDDLSAESHSRRLRMQELYNTMLHAKLEGFYADAMNILKEWIDFAEEEGLIPLMGEYHGTMGELYLLLAEKGSADGKKVDREATLREALREARMAVNAWVRLGSMDVGKTEEARVLLERVFELKERKGKGR